MHDRRLTHYANRWFDEEGFTLAEALVSTAITVTVGLVVSSLLFSLLRSHQWFLQRTDQYESLRIAGAYVRQDGRFSTMCDFTWDSLRMSSTAEDYVLYKILSSGAGTYDLHRMVYHKGGLQTDEIVGWDVLPPVFTPDPAKKTFMCTGSTPSARVRLQKRALPGQKAGPTLDLFSFQRGG
jgi:hypothetical protein